MIRTVDEGLRDFGSRKGKSTLHLRGVAEMETEEKNGKLVFKEIKDEKFLKVELKYLTVPLITN